MDCASEAEQNKRNSGVTASPARPVFLRPRDPIQQADNSKSQLCHNNSSDTYSSVSTTQSFNMR